MTPRSADASPPLAAKAHPSTAVTMGEGAAKAGKCRTGTPAGSERGKNGMTR